MNFLFVVDVLCGVCFHAAFDLGGGGCGVCFLFVHSLHCLFVLVISRVHAVFDFRREGEGEEGIPLLLFYV